MHCPPSSPSESRLAGHWRPNARAADKAVRRPAGEALAHAAETPAAAAAANPSRVSAALWLTTLCSIAGSTFCYIYLASFIYKVSDNILYSDAVLMAPMVIPVVLCLALHRLSAQRPPRSLLIATNVVGLLVCVATFGWIGMFPWLSIPACLIIGTLDAVQRISRIIAIKRYLTDDGVKHAVPLTMTAQFIAGGLSGAALSLFKVETTPMQALAITGAFYLTAALTASALPRLGGARGRQADGAAARSLSALVALLRNDPRLRFQFMNFAVFITVLQGFINVSRVALPAHELNLPEPFVGILQAVGSSAALTGALAFYGLMRRRVSLSSDIVSALCTLAMVGAVALGSVAASYSLYFVYIFLFELVFFRYQSDLVMSCSADGMPLVATFQYAVTYLGMIVAIAAGGLVTQHFGLLAAGLLFGAASFGLTAYRYASGRLELAPLSRHPAHVK
jgi:hypothetical protein